MSARISMRKIAEVAGVSVATVSQVLGNRPENYCSEETRERIRKVAAELGYRRNIGYKLMHSMTTRTAGVLISSPLTIQEIHLHELTLRLLTEFDKHNYVTFCNILPLDEEAAISKVNEYISRGVEHLVFIGAPCGHKQIAANMEKMGTTYVSTSCEMPRWVHSNTEAGQEKLFRMLKERCGDKFRYICEKKTLSFNDHRIAALCRVFDHMPPDEVKRRMIVTITNMSPENRLYTASHKYAAEATRELLKREPDLLGLAYQNDAQAMGGASELLKQNISNIIVTGFNGNDTVQNYPYPIISPAFNVPEMTRLLVKYALNSEPCNIQIEPVMPEIMAESR